jgi:hypothetical protein
MTSLQYETKFGSTITLDPCNPIHKIHLIFVNEQVVNKVSGISEGVVLSIKVIKLKGLRTSLLLKKSLNNQLCYNDKIISTVTHLCVIL